MIKNVKYKKVSYKKIDKFNIRIEDHLDGSIHFLINLHPIHILRVNKAICYNPIKTLKKAVLKNLYELIEVQRWEYIEDIQREYKEQFLKEV